MTAEAPLVGASLFQTSLPFCTSLLRRKISSVDNRRLSPGASPISVRKLIRLRTRRSVGWPTAAVILRTCLLRPSINVISIQQVGTFSR